MICHASLDENGKTIGTTPGDQTGKEVVVRSWYSKPWNYVLRCTDATMRSRIVKAMEAAANNPSVGYSQPHRNDLLKSCKQFNYNPANASIPCDCDCSSLVTVACIYAGIPEKDLYKSNNCCTTSNIRSRLMATGKFITLTDKKYLNGDQYLYAGDILLREPGHVAVNITDGKFVTEESKTKDDEIRMVDLSKYNTVTDYRVLAEQIKYVIVRVGYRSYEKGIITEDPLFKKHIENCIANGMTVGVYFYDQSINEAEAIEQANWVVNMIKPYKLGLPIYIDSEYSNKQHDGRADNISKEQRTNNVLAFCNRIQQLNYGVGVYASDSWFKSMLNFDQIKHLNIWCARYSTQKPTISKYDIWQYGSEYYSWATGVIDTNIIYNMSSEIKPTVPSKPTQTQESINLTPEKAILLMGQVNIKEGTLNVRKLPDTNAPIVTQLRKGSYIQLRGDLGTWYRVDLGYVSKKYIKEVHGIVTGDKLRVRSTPDSNLQTNVITTLPINTEVIICTAGNGWYYILLSDGTLGWVSGDYIKLK